MTAREYVEALRSGTVAEEKVAHGTIMKRECPNCREEHDHVWFDGCDGAKGVWASLDTNQCLTTIRNKWDTALMLLEQRTVELRRLRLELEQKG